jgi:glycerophosphoryl diester phosphodiesterase
VGTRGPFSAETGVPVVVGHRGVRGQTVRENTPPAFAAAAAAGATWVELDARRSADGVPVVHHDGWTPAGVAVVERTAAQLATDGIFTLADVLASLPAGLGVDLEVKNLPGEPDYDPDDGVVAPVVEVLRPQVGTRPLLVSSFNPLTVATLVSQVPEVPAGLVHFDSLSVPAAAEIAAEQGAVVVCSRLGAPNLDADGIAAVHDAGLQILVWTVNDLRRAAQLAEGGADALCTDDPGALVTMLAATPPR